MQHTYLLTVLTFLPVAGTLALLLLRDDDHVWIRRLALVTAVAEFAISLLLLRGFDAARGRLPVGGISRLDSAAADSLSPGRRRPERVSCSADDAADADFDSGVLEID